MGADLNMSPSSPATRIDRLLLDFPGSSTRQARQVALMVAAGLADAGVLPQAGDLPTLRVAITADHRTDPEILARRVVAATLRELARTL
jgi:hypothetical protein